MTTSDLYREIVIDHYRNPRHRGELSSCDAQGKEDNVVCGDTIMWQLRFDANGRISHAAWSGEGCALSQASASLLSEQLGGKTRDELLAIDDSAVLQHIGTSISPSRKNCATLCIKALHKALA